MSRTPRLTGSELLAALSNVGFTVKRIRGSHHFLIHADGRSTVLPIHSGETIGPGLMTKILRDCKLTEEERRQSGIL
jgi:predicted RNA binding protein YcfA (HicA-like mRNA interferase family)